ncbi:MAG: putative exosortase interaction protein [Herminiimonas sp.]|nr:putative exosortase interaction protein [Herminiimonas sp.]
MPVSTRVWLTRGIAVFAILSGSVANASTTVNAGYELLTSLPGTVFGGVPYAGVPLGTFDFGGTIGTQSVGNADEVVHRLSDTSGTPIATQLLALQLVTTVPVDFGLGTGFYYITLQSARGGPASLGQRTIFFGPEAPAGSPHGTFDSFFDVFFDLRLGSLNGPIAISGDSLLTANAVPWSHFPSPGALELNGVNTLSGGNDRSRDFWPDPLDALGPAGEHRVTVASIPEPATYLLLSIGLMVCFGHRIFSRRMHPGLLA